MLFSEIVERLRDKDDVPWQKRAVHQARRLETEEQLVTKLLR